MNESEIIAYAIALLTSLGLMPYIRAFLVAVVAMAITLFLFRRGG